MKTLYISGEIGWDVTPDSIREQIDSKSTEKLRVIVNSVGGYVSDGFEIYNILKAYKGEIEVVIGVIAASIASYIAMVAPLEKRKGFKNSSFMIHEVQAGIYGRARDLATYAERVEGLNNIMAEAYSEGLDLTKEESRAMMVEDKYFTGWEALVESNIISEILDLEDIDIPKKEEDEDQFIIFETFMNEAKKDIDISILKAKVYETEQKVISDINKSTQDLTKAAAKLKLNETKVNKESNTDKSVEDKTNLKMEEKTMPKLQEFLNSNPDAKAEYDALLSAKDQEIEQAKANNDVGKERARIFNILKFSGFEPASEAAKAINEGIDSAQFAQDELMRERNKRKGKGQNKVDFGELKTAQLPGDQDEIGKKEAQGKTKDMGDYDKESEALAEKYF